jgi:hypothetical protein
MEDGGMKERWMMAGTKVGWWVGVLLCVVAGMGSAQEREAPLRGMIALESDPAGAEVYVGDSLIGRTPLRVRRSMLDSIRAWFPARAAWGARMVRPDTAAVSAELGVMLLRFDPARFPGAPPLSDAPVVGTAEERRNGFVLPRADVLLPGTLAVGAGVAAVMLKQHADGLYDDYLRTGDDSLLSQTKKYDIYAGVSLALLQVGLGYFIYRLLAE